MGPKVISGTALDPNVGRLALRTVTSGIVMLTPEGLFIGEGVETVLAAIQHGFKPAWALGSAGAVKNFPALSSIGSLSNIVDNRQERAIGGAGCRVRICSALAARRKGSAPVSTARSGHGLRRSGCGGSLT